jgi:hypothetical protein
MILYHKYTGLRVKVGNAITIPAYRTTATVAGWDPNNQEVWAWDRAEDVGLYHKARPWDTSWTSCEWRNE